MNFCLRVNFFAASVFSEPFESRKKITEIIARAPNGRLTIITISHPIAKTQRKTHYRNTTSN